MNHLILLLFLMAGLASQASCPNSFDYDGKKYCAEVNWQNSDRFIRGKYHATTTPSPVLIKMNTRAKNKNYSRAKISIWLESDATKSHLLLKDFRVFPYMIMQHGHHHGTSYDWIQHSDHYEIAGVGFSKMMGCWQLRITDNGQEDLANSDLMMNISEFTNISLTEQDVIEQKCKNSHP